MRTRAAPVELALVAANVVAGFALVVVMTQDTVPPDLGVPSAPASSDSSGAPDRSPVLVVVASDSPGDEVVGRSVAGTLDGELLVLPRTGITAGIADDLAQWRPARILIVGGTEAVSAASATSLSEHTAGTVTRVAGTDRYATAATAATQHFTGPVERLRVLSGASLAALAPDALAPDALAPEAESVATHVPVLLVERDAVPSATAEALRRLRPQHIEVVGGQDAISPAVVLELGSYASGDVSRVQQA